MENFYEICIKNGTDKCTYHGYHYYYPRFLESLRNKKFKMLEIGYQEGFSAKVWEEYFPFSDIYFMDINTEGIFPKHRVIKGDQSNIDDLKRVGDEIGSAKFIIDDGSHNPLHQIQAFIYFFKNILEDGGIYIIEDIETSYWKPDSFCFSYKVGDFNLLKNTTNYIDHINSEFSKIENSLRISTITYGQNCIIITKQTKDETEYFRRNYRFGNNLK